MTLYKYNHLSVRRLGPDDRAEFPGYPIPWFVVVEDRGMVLGDGPTDEAAKADYQRKREPRGPSPEALAQLRRERLRRSH